LAALKVTIGFRLSFHDYYLFSLSFFAPVREESSDGLTQRREGAKNRKEGEYS
jgi:hypothetical protein